MAALLPYLPALASALAPHISKMFGGSSGGSGGDAQGGLEGYNRVSTFDPGQQQLFNQTAQGLGGIQPQIMQYLQQLLSGGGESQKAFEAPYMRQFNEQTIPGLARQFAGMGALSSSGFQQALGQAGAGLSENLAMLREGQRMQAVNPIMQMIQSLLGQSTQAFSPKQPSGWQNFLTGLAPGIGSGIAQAGGNWALNKWGSPSVPAMNSPGTP